MKKLLSIILSLALIIGMLVIPAQAASVEDLDNTGELAALFDFEDDGYKVRFSDGLSVWQKDAKHALSYYNGSWGSGGIANNPVTVATGVGDSVVNSSAKAWNYNKNSADHWATAGGSVLHIYTQDGPEPLILENNVTYKLSFDYMVSSTHRTDEFVNGSTVGKIGETAEDIASVGYGYKTDSSDGLHPFNTPVKTIEQFITYSEKANETGTYTGDGKKTRQVGSWYHVEYTFTPTGLAELDFSSEGTINCPQKAPFLIFYMKEFSGTSIFLDNVKIQSQIVGTLNAMGGTLTGASYKGFIGDTAEMSLPTRYGYDFDKWYTDGELKNEFSGILTRELHGGYLYAGWDNTKIGFESFAKMPTNMSNNLSSSTDRAFSGKKSLRYSYSRNSLEFFYNTRTTADNMFSIKPIDSDGMYKISFKYYIDGSTDITVYPVTSGSTSSTAYKAYTGNSRTLYATDKGQWKTEVIYFTAEMLSGGNNVGLHVEAASNANAKVYFDDVTVTESRGGASLTLNAGEGTIDGKTSATINVDYGQELVFDGLYYKNHFVEGYYYDAGFNEPCEENAFLESMADTTLYVKWSTTENFEHYGYNTKASIKGFSLTNNYAKSGSTSLVIDVKAEESGGTAFASITDAESGVSYVLDFYYYAPVNTSAVIKPVAVANGAVKLTYDGFTLNGTSGGWKKAAVVFTANASDTVIALAVTYDGAIDTKIYFDDITVTALGSNQNCVIFDTMSVDGNRTASIGTTGQAVTYAETPTAIGKSFDGWYKDEEFKTAFSETVYSANCAVYAKMVDSAVSEISGDVDGNGDVNAADLARLKKYLAGYDIEVSGNADVDKNGKINAVDLVKLYKLIAA